MTTKSVLKELKLEGLNVCWGEGCKLKVSPAGLLTPHTRQLIRMHKHQLLLEVTALEIDDARVTCTACKHLKRGNKCSNHRYAGLKSSELATEFTRLLQHCSGFYPLCGLGNP